ncbi:GDSL-type esterase/lipase family protein [Methyloprofundus sedimenti]|uniref:GDSL-type esterase/lipase family protein n=1 Tax=Methyloprofundus sedimenti TaxID=1420851 RepID=UPI001E638227|nr:GDSL-type esterase/lipase family protein [Methyloprofundus sedimenti]
MKQTSIIIVFLLLSSCGRPTPPVYDKISQDAIILAFGDSLTYGTGSSESANYPSLLSTLSQHKVINAGITGEISHIGLKRLPVLLDKYQPELMILIHGGNDMLRRIPQQQIASNLRQMINEARQRNIKVVMLGVPKPRFFFIKQCRNISASCRRATSPD